MEIRIADFNVENLFSRFALLNKDPAIREEVEKNEFQTFSMAPKTRKGQNWHQLERETIDDVAQKNTARVIDAINADIICLQEVEDLPTLRNFADKVLKPIQEESHNKEYSYFLLIDGNDIRGIDVAIASRYPFGKIETHMYEEDETGFPLFSRDCLEVEVAVGSERLHFFIQHFKSQLSRPGDLKGVKKRTRQARRVVGILHEKSSEISDGMYMVVGDLNDTPESESLKPLLDSDLNLYNAITALPASERWTHIYGKEKAQLDYMLLSQTLKGKIKNFNIERRGISTSRTAYTGPRFPTVGKDGTEASDHCASYVDLVF